MPSTQLVLGSTTPRAPIAATRSFLRRRQLSLSSSRPVDGHALKPHGSGFYYSSKGGLDPTKTRVPPMGLKLIARHKDHSADLTQAAEIDIACPAGSLTQAQKLPNGRDSLPAPGACTSN